MSVWCYNEVPDTQRVDVARLKASDTTAIS